MSLRIQDRDRGYAGLMSRVRRARNRIGAASAGSPTHRISIGIHGDEAALSYDGREGSIALVEVAAAQEYGEPSIGLPERSFIRSWFDANRPRLARELKYAEAAELIGGDPGAVVQLAQRWASEVREWITSRRAGLRALAPATVAERERAGIGQETPLLATGQLVEAIRAMVDGEYV